MFFKNVAGQYITIHAWDAANNCWKTGDSANITAGISKDGAFPAATNDVNPTEGSSTLMPGAYRFLMTKAESNCESLELVPQSSSTSISCIPVSIYPSSLSALGTLAYQKQIRGAIAGKREVKTTKDEIKVYDDDGVLLVTLARTIVGNYAVWTPTWA
jgi:hypothetical protein